MTAQLWTERLNFLVSKKPKLCKRLVSCSLCLSWLEMAGDSNGWLKGV